MGCVIGLDIGTTSTIGILIALPDHVLATASRPVTFSAPQQGWAEENPEEWWQNVCQIVPELLERGGIEGKDVKAIGVTGMLPAVVLLDEAGRLLRPSIQQSDGRCGAEVADLAAELDEAIATARAERTSPTEDYLLGMGGLLSDYLEAGVEALGISLEEAGEGIL